MHFGIANPRWWAKRARHTRRMRNPQFYMSGERPMLPQSVSLSVMALHRNKRWVNAVIQAFPSRLYQLSTQLSTQYALIEAFGMHKVLCKIMCTKAFTEHDFYPAALKTLGYWPHVWVVDGWLDRRLLQAQTPSQIIFKIGENISWPSTSGKFYHGGCIPINVHIMGPFRTFYQAAFKGSRVLSSPERPVGRSVGRLDGRSDGRQPSQRSHGSFSRMARTFIVLRSRTSSVMEVLPH